MTMTNRNENRKGFKKIKVEWDVVKFGELANFRNGLNFLKTDKGYKYKIIGVTGFQNHFSPQKDSIEYVEVKTEIVQDDFLHRNDLLFVRSNGNKALIGRCLYIDKEYKQVAFSGFTIRARIKTKDVSPLYLALYFRSKEFKKQMLLYGSGTNISNLSQEILSKINIPLPSLPEQKKIAEILSTWDKAIDQVRKLIEAKKKLKKGLMQQLLTGSMRFPGFGKPVKQNGELPVGWENIKLKDISKIRFSGVNKKSEKGQKKVRLCNYMDVYKNDYIVAGLPFMEATASDSEINSFKIEKGDVIITKDSETPDDIGVPAVVTEKMENVICGYHLALIRPDKKTVNSVFIGNVMASSQMHKQFCRLANGATRFGLSTSAVENLNVRLPKIEEQQNIASLLFSYDKEIEFLDKEKDNLQSQKKGLMQKLLTGEKRVKV